MRRKETTPEQRVAIVSRVDALKKSEGLSLQDAWAKAGHGHMTNYFTWKRKGLKRPYRRKVIVEAAPAPHIVAQFVLFSDGSIANMQDLKRAA